MTSKQSLFSALLAAALFALPITASARDHGPQRNFAPQLRAYNRVAVAPHAPIVQVHDRDDCRWGGHRGWWRHDRDDWRWNDHDRDDAWRHWKGRPYYASPDYCQRRPYVNNYYYRQGYRPYYYEPDSYNYATPYYGAQGNGRLMALMHQRDGAVIQYRLAVRRGDRVAAEHLANDIHDLNGRIASMRGASYGYSGYTGIDTPYLNNYSYGSGYGSGYGNSGLESLVGPLLGSW